MVDIFSINPSCLNICIFDESPCTHSSFLTIHKYTVLHAFQCYTMTAAMVLYSPLPTMCFKALAIVFFQQFIHRVLINLLTGKNIIKIYSTSLGQRCHQNLRHSGAGRGVDTMTYGRVGQEYTSRPCVKVSMVSTPLPDPEWHSCFLSFVFTYLLPDFDDMYQKQIPY